VERYLDLTHVNEKLEEARRSLARMTEQERRLIREPFTDHLNAFLAAGTAVHDPFFRDKAIKPWYEKWNDPLRPKDPLRPDERRLLDAMREARHDEAHIARKWSPALSRSSRKRTRAGFKHCVDHEEINIGVGSPYYDASGRVEGFRSAALLLTLGINTNILVEKKIHFYIVDGKKRKVTDLCAEYLALLQRMVADFKADNP
jgi:hypothetical protein